MSRVGRRAARNNPRANAPSFHSSGRTWVEVRQGRVDPRRDAYTCQAKSHIYMRSLTDLCVMINAAKSTHAGVICRGRPRLLSHAPGVICRVRAGVKG
eukprot:scaffold153_cov70-Phaeocystis_antarctica.AAC.1